MKKDIFCLSETQKKDIINKIEPVIAVVEKYDPKPINAGISKYNSKQTVIINPDYYVCFCKKHNGAKIKKSKCLYTSHNFSSLIASKTCTSEFKNDFEDKYQFYYNSTFKKNNIKTKTDLKRLLYVVSHPLKENSIIIYDLIVSVNYSEEFSLDNISFNIKNYIEVIPNEYSKAFSVKGEAQSVFDILKINSKTCSNASNNIFFENNCNVLSFLNDNPKFAQFSGVQNFLFSTSLIIPSSALFEYYIALFSMFPCVEQLVKANSYVIIDSMISKMMEMYNKDELYPILDNFKKIINPNATTSKNAIILPPYIVDYLQNKKAPLDLYVQWSTIYSYDKLSKEQFLKLINDDKYFDLNVFFEEHGFSLCEIIKYGKYKLEKLYNYFIKYGNNYFILNFVNLLKDYLDMCDLLNIEADPYPSQLKETHDSIMKLYKANKDKLNDATIKDKADLISKYIPDNDDYLIIIPNSVSDLTQEGINQHNCVGSYANKIIKGQCFVFFIREKTSPLSSFITADCTKNGLNQLMYRNNVSCTDSNIKAYANSFCEKIKNLL